MAKGLLLTEEEAIATLMQYSLTREETYNVLHEPDEAKRAEIIRRVQERVKEQQRWRIRFYSFLDSLWPRLARGKVTSKLHTPSPWK